MRTQILLLSAALSIGSTAHAGLKDWLPGFLRGEDNQSPLPNTSKPTQAAASSSPSVGRAVFHSVYDLADREALFAAKKRIIQAVVGSMEKPFEVQPQYSAIVVQALNDAFFELYDNLYDRPERPSKKDRKTMSDQNEKYRQLEILYERYERLPPEIAGSWAMAKVTLDSWYRSGTKQPKVAKKTPNPIPFLVFSNGGLRDKALKGFSSALDSELEKSPNLDFNIALLALVSNQLEYYGAGGTYPETVFIPLVSTNQWSNYVSLSASLALTRLAQINTVEAWNQFLLAFVGGNTVMPAPHYGLHEFMTELFLESVTPEKTQALANAAPLIKSARIRGDEFHRRSALGLIAVISDQYAEIPTTASAKACGTTLNTQTQSSPN